VPALLEVQNLTVDFATAQGAARAVREVSFAIAPGEVLGLVGESGSGKSVSSLAVLRLLPPQARVGGRILFDGEDVLSLPIERMRALRGAGISMIFQEPMTALNPVMRIGDQVAEAVRAHPEVDRSTPPYRENQAVERGPRLGGTRSVSKAEAWTLAVEALRTVAIPEPERRARDYPHQLSGGMRKRVALAQTFINKPEILLMDEPFSALDMQTRTLMQDELLQLWGGTGSVVFVTHDLEEAIALADRVFVLTARPATLKKVYEIDLPRPRVTSEIRYAPQFVELSRDIWHDLREEVQIA
jgi:NitT/TauT family transport system ATP-binding protein